MSSKAKALACVAVFCVACSNPPTDKEVPVVIVDGDDVGTVVDIQCGASRIECGGECVDPSIDSRHCAACDVACAAGTVCSNGDCLPVPDDCRLGGECPPRYYCDDTTGFCAVGCSSNTDCAGGAFCELESHACLCPTEGQVLCGSECVAESALTCGVTCESCNGPARSTATCEAGQCGFDCDPGHSMCDGVCAPCPTGSAVLETTCLATQCVASACEAGHEICEGSCAPCPSASAGSSFGCDGGECVVTDCPTGTKLCDGECASCPSDPNGTAQCAGDRCVLTCGAGFHECDGRCVRDDDVTACGASCATCPTDPDGTPQCSGGQCALLCDAGFRECQGGCAACPGGAGVASTRCAGASCVVATCSAGYQPCASGCCQPPPIGIVQVTGEFGSVNSLALDSEGFPHIAHAGGDVARYSYWDGAQWNHEDIMAGDHVAIVLDANDVPHFVIHNELQSSGFLWYATKAAGTWSTREFGTVNYAATPDIVIDSLGLPRISYHGANASNVPDTLAFATGPAFISSQIDTGETGYGSSLAVVGDVIHLMYNDISVDTVYTRTFDVNVGVWSNTHNVNGTVSVNFVTPTSIALSANGQGYGVWETSSGVGIARWTGSLWADRESIPGAQGEDPDVALSPAGVPSVVFHGPSFQGLRLAQRSGSTWNVSTLDNAANTGLDPDIEFGPGGVAHVVYFSITDNALRYTRF